MERVFIIIMIVKFFNEHIFVIFFVSFLKSPQIKMQYVSKHSSPYT